MNIVMITTGKRDGLLRQSIDSLVSNAGDWTAHTLTLVVDGAGLSSDIKMPLQYTSIFATSRPGASACRNIGASSVPRYRRQPRLMFLDDDVYMCPKWDGRIELALNVLNHAVVSGHAHPFNPGHGLYRGLDTRIEAASVLSSVNMAMDWSVWDSIGFFVEPGGPGGSEDVNWCQRAAIKAVGFAVTNPQCVIHCGLKSSNGKEIVGYDAMVDQNRRLIKEYGLEGKVRQI
jgi:hypothetical protein